MSDLHLRNLPVPFFSQRKNTYIHKERYSKDKKDENGNLIEVAGQIKPGGKEYSMACNSCNITCAAMVLHYFGITDETPDTIMERYFDRKNDTDKIALENSSTAVGALESWKNLEKCINGLYKEKIKVSFGEKVAAEFVTYYNQDPNESSNGKLTISKIKESISHGYPVIMNYGTLKEFWSATGHIVVVRGFTQIKGKEYIIVNDPWGVPINKNESFKTESEGSLPGVYYESLGYNFANYAGGTGDNCAIPLSEFQKVINTDSVSSALIIKAPLWNYPDGGVISDSADIYQKEILGGGGFPLKSSSLWHNGIHVHTAGPVYSVGAGRLIAARCDMEPPETGDTGFLLVRHNVVLNSAVKAFYALYMHTQPLDLKLYASRLFLHGAADQDVKWVYQLFRHMLPAHYIVFTGGNSSSESGLINEKFRNIPVYNASCKDGNFYKGELSSIKLEQRILVNPLPVKPALFAKLLDPASYGDSDFLSNMTRTASFEKQIGAETYIFFFYKSSLVCTSIGGDTFTVKGLINRKQFRHAAMKLCGLAKGTVTTFADSVQPDNEIAVKDAVKGIFGSAWSKKEFDADLAAKKESWSECFEKTVQRQGQAFSVSAGKDTACFEYVLESIYCLNERNSITSVKESAADAITDFTSKYAKARKAAFSAYLSSLENANRSRETSGEPVTRAADAGKSMDILKRLCTGAVGTVNKACGAALSASGINDQPNGAAVIQKLVKILDSEPESVPYAVKKNVLEYIAVSLMGMPLENIIPSGGKEDYFKISDSSVKRLLDEYALLFEKTGRQYASALSTLASDPFIEFGKCEKIAVCGSYKTHPAEQYGRQQLHFEIFSQDEILGVDSALAVNDTDTGLYLDPAHCVEVFKPVIPESWKTQLEQPDSNFLLPEEISRLNRECPEIRDGAYRHLSEWADMDWSSIFGSSYIHRQVSVYDAKTQSLSLLSKDSFIEQYHTPYMWMSPAVFAAENQTFKDSCAWYYHPFRFLQKIQAASQPKGST